MDGTKYGQYILRERGGSQTTPDASAKPVVLEGLEDWGGIQHRMKWKFILKPSVLMETQHSHDFDEFLIFLSCNPTDELDFSAELELKMGDEAESNIITAPTVVCIPEGMVHGPLVCQSIVKPILFSHIYIAPKYRQIPAS